MLSNQFAHTKCQTDKTRLVRNTLNDTRMIRRRRSNEFPNENKWSCAKALRKLRTYTSDHKKGI